MTPALSLDVNIVMNIVNVVIDNLVQPELLKTTWVRNLEGRI